jgi:hypothetical protein
LVPINRKGLALGPDLPGADHFHSLQRDDGSLRALIDGVKMKDTQLAREVLNGANLQTLLANEMRLSNNPLGRVTMPSAMIIPSEKVMTWSDWMAEKVGVVRRKSRGELIPVRQMGLVI